MVLRLHFHRALQIEFVYRSDCRITNCLRFNKSASVTAVSAANCLIKQICKNARDSLSRKSSASSLLMVFANTFKNKRGETLFICLATRFPILITKICSVCKCEMPCKEKSTRLTRINANYTYVPSCKYLYFSSPFKFEMESKQLLSRLSLTNKQSVHISLLR